MGFSLGSLNPFPSIGRALNETASTLTGGSVGGKQGLTATGIRDSAETAAALAGNYFLPGSSLLTSRLTSKGSQGNLSKPGGIVGQLGTGLAGLGIGSGYTSIPASVGGNFETSLFGGGATGASGGASTTMPLTPVEGYTAGTDAGFTGATSMPLTPVEGYTAGAGAGTTAATDAAAGMSTAEKIKLGLMGTGTALGAVAAFGKKNPASPSVDPTAGKSSATAQALFDQYNSGTLSVADQQGIAQWHQEAMAASDQYYAQAGLADSSMAQQAKAQIGQQAEQMRQQALNNYLQQGLSAAGIAAGPLATQVNATLQQDQQAQQAQSQFFQTLALMGASYGSGA